MDYTDVRVDFSNQLNKNPVTISKLISFAQNLYSWTKKLPILSHLAHKYYKPIKN